MGDISKFVASLWLVCTYLVIHSVQGRGLKGNPSPFSVDCLRTDASGEVPDCDPKGEENVCCFGLDCIEVTEYKESEKGKLLEVTSHKCINSFQASVPGSPLCLKTGKDGTFPLCNPKIENGNCCMGLSCKFKI